MSTETQDVPAAQGGFWRWLYWTPLALMLLSAAGLLALYWRGGMLKITAWYLLQLIPPLLGAVTLIGVVVYALARRRFSLPVMITLAAALLALLPLVLWFVPVAYPASLAETTPAATVRLPAD